jgi:hypothetical protein
LKNQDRHDMDALHLDLQLQVGRRARACWRLT